MKLHRLVLTNYRGITHREIEFPDRGVVVVSGANEIGKSSMIEALDLLLEAKDRSTKKEVKQVKPTHADVGAEITAEISTGPYRFIYHKRFHKQCETELTVLAPRREQLTGDEAHERVRALLDETVDLELWRAQRVLQAASTAAVDLSGCDALSRALDVAAGEAVQLSGAEPLLIDRIDAEYLRYFTPTGRPTGEWAAADQPAACRRRRGRACAAAVAEVDDAVRRHAALTEDLALSAGQRARRPKRLTTARAAADAVAELTRNSSRRRWSPRPRMPRTAAVGRGAHRTAPAARRHRRPRRGDRRLVQAAAAQAAEEDATAREVQEAAEAAAEEAHAAVPDQPGPRRCGRAAPSSDCPTATRPTGWPPGCPGSTPTQRELDAAQRELAGIALTDASMRDIEAAAAAVELAAGQAELASAHIELAAIADVERAGRQARRSPLDAGATWSVAATAPIDIELPGVLTARVVPGAPASDTQAKLDAAQQVLAAALAAGKVDDVAAARAVDRRRRELVANRDRLSATAEALTGDDTVEAMRARLAALRGGEPAEAGLWDVRRRRRRPRRTRRRGGRAPAGGRRLRDPSQGRRRSGEAIGGEVHPGQRAAREGHRRPGRTDCRARATGDPARVSRATTTRPSSAEADGEEARRATGRVAELGGELAATNAGQRRRRAATMRCAAPSRSAAGTTRPTEALREVTAQLKVYGTEGRKGQLDAAETEREHAEAEYVRVHRSRPRRPAVCAR